MTSWKLKRLLIENQGQAPMQKIKIWASAHPHALPSSSTTGLDLYLYFHWSSRYWAPIFFINRPSAAIIDAKPFSFRQEWRRRFALPASIHSIKPNKVDIYYTHSLNTFNKVKFYRMLSTLAVVFSTYTCTSLLMPRAQHFNWLDSMACI